MCWKWPRRSWSRPAIALLSRRCLAGSWPAARRRRPHRPLCPPEWQSPSGGSLLRLGEYVPDRNEQGGDDGPYHDAIESEQFKAAQGGDEDNIVRHLGVAAHEHRREEIVDQAHHEYTAEDKDHALPDSAGDQQIERHRNHEQ